MTASTVRFGIMPCGCLHESPRDPVVLFWRCVSHADSYVRVRGVWGWRRCESCRRAGARLRVTFSDGMSVRVCDRCDPGGLR